MINTEKLINNVFELDPSIMISLYKIDLKEKGEYLFHAGENGFKKNIIFNKQEYDFFPMIVEGFEIQGNGRLPRPKMTFSNHLGVVSLRLAYFKDFVNHKVTRIKTFVKYLDHENFPNSRNPFVDPDSSVTYQEDIFYVNEKTQENASVVQFELVSILELESASVPNRKIYSNNCTWSYRSELGCRYGGKPIADEKNKRFLSLGYNGMTVGEETYLYDSFDKNTFGANIYEWSSTEVYKKGDIVFISAYDGDKINKPDSFYVCLYDDVESFPPRDRENWVLDECDKSLCGCRLRFSESSLEAGGGIRNEEKWTEQDKGLPFGGFPGVDPYDYQ
jgi:lambda family phage minor tail protein L